jgi:hypothetical protein
MLGAQTLATMIYGLDNNFEKTLPENKFLHKYKFVDEKLRLIDKQGRLIDAEGRLIDDNGRYIDEQGNYVDKFGNKVDKDGEYVVETEPFLDEEGKPIILETEVAKQDDAPNVATKPAESQPVVAQPQPPAPSDQVAVSA